MKRVDRVGLVSMERIDAMRIAFVKKMICKSVDWSRSMTWQVERIDEREMSDE